MIVDKLNKLFKTTKPIKFLAIIGVIGFVLAILTATIQHTLAFEDYEVTEANDFIVKIQNKKASSTATIRYKTAAWYMFPEAIQAVDYEYNSASEWTALGGKKIDMGYGNRIATTDNGSVSVYYDTYLIPAEEIVPEVLKWKTDENGNPDRQALKDGVDVFVSRSLTVLKNGAETETYYCYNTIADVAEWSTGALGAFQTSFDIPLNLKFNAMDFRIEIVDTFGNPIDFTYPSDYDGIRLYGEKLESFAYPGVITDYSYQGFDLIKEYSVGGSNVVKSGGPTATSTGTYSDLKLVTEGNEHVGEYDLILRFKYAKNNDVFVPTDTPTPTISVTPTPTTAPPVTVEPTVAPTPGPDEIVNGNYYHYFTTDLGHSMYSVINDTDYIVATHSGSGYDGTLLSAKAITRTKSYYTGTDGSGNTWYFIPDGTEATFVHPAIYNGHNVNTENIKNITELVFPSTITRGSTTYTVTHIGGGTEKYHVIEDNSDSSSDTTSYDYDPHYGYYSYHKEGGTTNIPTLIYSDQKYAFGVLGNGYIETNGYNDKTNNTTGYYECTDIYRNYYVYNTTLRSITIPDTVKYIEDYAFLYCQNLSEIKGGNGLIRIGVQAFGAEESIPLNHCMNYTNISEDTDGTQINNTQIEYHEYNLDTKWVTYVTESGVSHTACNDGDEHRYCTQTNAPNTEMLLHTKKVINLTKNKLELPVFPVLTTIQQQAFNYRANLWEVKLNSTVNSIGWGAFNGCYLDSIEIPSTSLSILSSGSTNQVKKPDYETLGTNKAGESRTIILSNPGTPAVKYGRTYPDYYRLKAGYTITYHSNNGMNETVQQISDMEYLVADYVYTIGDYAVESNGNVIKLTANYDNTITITQVGTMTGGVQKVLYQGTLTDYETQYDSGTTTSSVPLSVDVTYLRGVDGSVWRYVYDTSHAYGLEKLDIPAGTEVYFFNGLPYYLSSDGYVMTVKLQAFDNSYDRNKSVTTSSKFGYTDYSDTTTYDYRFNSYSSVKANVLEQRGERIVMQRSSDSTWHFLDRVDYLDRDNDGNIIYESWLDSEGNVRQDVTFSKMSGVSGEPVAVKIDNEYTGRSYIITKNGLAYRKYSDYDNIYTFRTMSYSGSISLTSIFGGEYGVIYDTSNQIISIKLESNKPVLTATGIYGPIKEAYPTDSGNYYYLTESGALCYYDSSTYTYTSILPGAKFTKVQVESIGAYALTDGGDVYDITTPTSPSVYIGGYGAKDFLFFPGSTYYRKMYVITSDGTLVGKGYKLYKGSNSEYVDSPYNLIQIPNIVEAQKITELSNNKFAVYTAEGVYVESNGVWNFHIVDKGCNFTAELWGTNWPNPGKKFANKWNTNAAGTGTSYNAGQLISLTSNLDLYAQWEASSDAPRIKYHPNGGNGGMADTVLSNGATSAILSKFGFSAPDGYVKKEPYCWNTSPNGTGTSYTDGATVTGITTDLTLYAQWVPTSSLAGQYTLVYWKYPYGTDNNSVWKTKTLSFGQTEVIEGAPVSPIDTTYTVTYELNKPAEMAVTPIAYTLTDENTKAYAKTSFNNRWRLYETSSSGFSSTSTYYPTGKSVHDLTMTSGKTLNLFPEMNDESRAEVYLPYTGAEGWIFRGWCEKSDGSGTIYAPAPPEGDEVAAYRPTKDITLYGIWEKDLTVKIPVLLDINSLYTCDAGTLAQSGLIDNFNLMTGTFDFYRNGALIADDVNDWAGWLETYDTYEITDFKPAAGYVVNGADTTYKKDGVHSIGIKGVLNDVGSLSGRVDIWLKASPASFTLSYDTQGGTMPAGAPASYTMSYHQSWNHTIHIPDRTGYVFNGWYSAPVLSDGVLMFDKTGVQHINNVHWATTLNGISSDKGVWLIGDCITYAQWTPKTTTITLDQQGATTSGTTSVIATYDANMPVPITLPKREYTVTYNANGGTCGTVSNSASYTFGGYYSAVNGGGTQYYKADGTSARTWNVDAPTATLYAKWTSNAVTLPTPSRTGYTFAGWYTAASGGNPAGAAGASYTPSANITLYALWTPNNYPLTIDGNKGTGSTDVTIPSASVTLTYDSNNHYYSGANHSNYLANNLATRDGYKLTGYFTATSGGTKVYNADGSVVKGTSYFDANGKYIYANSLKVYAQWSAVTYPVPLDPQGATGDTTPSVTPTFDDDMPSITVPKREYTVTFNPNGGTCGTTSLVSKYTFGGYFTGTNGTGTQYYKADGTSARTWNIASSITLYAKWTSTAITLPTPYRVGYTFAGWYTSANGGDAKGMAGAGYTPTSDITLYAHWTANNRTLTIDGNKGGGTSAVTVPYSSVTLTFDSTNHYYNGSNHSNYLAGNLATRDGYDFTGYYTAPTGGIQLYTSTGAIANGGTISYSGYVTGYYFYQNLFKVDTNITVYAQWKAKNYTLTLNPNGGVLGSGDSSPYTMTFDTANYSDISWGLPTRVGYDFAGWWTAASGGTQVYDANGICTKDGTYFNATGSWVYPNNMTLYAHWNAKSYSVTIDGNKGVGSTAVTVPYSSVTLTFDSTNHRYNNLDHSNYLAENLATRDGYTLTGYFTAPSGGTQLYTSAGVIANGGTVSYPGYTTGYYFYQNKYKVADALKIYAQWAPVKYKITLNLNDTGAIPVATIQYSSYEIVFDTSGHIYGGSTHTDYLNSNLPTRHGYTFTGWWTAPSGGTKVYDDKGVITNEGTYFSNNAYVYAGNPTLYAQWTANTYTLSLENNKGSGSTPVTIPHKTISITYDSTIHYYNGSNHNNYLAENLATRIGYDFTGYYTAETGGVKIYTETGALAANTIQDVRTTSLSGYYFYNGNWKVVGPLTLYAQWTPKVYHVTLNDRGALSTNHTTSVDITFDQKGASIVIPTKTGYDFNGYYTGTRGSGTKYYDKDGISVKPWTEDTILELYAYWTPQPIIYPELNDAPVVTPQASKVVDFDLNNSMSSITLSSPNYDVATAVPSTENLHILAKVGKYRFSGKVVRKTGLDDLHIYVKIPYRTQHELPDETLEISGIQYKTYDVIVDRAYAYWIVESNVMRTPTNIEVFNNAMINDGYSFTTQLPSNNQLHYEVTKYSYEEHVASPDTYDADGTKALYLEYATPQYVISYGNSAPDLTELAKTIGVVATNYAYADTTQFHVKSDKLFIETRTILSDVVSDNGVGYDCNTATINYLSFNIPLIEYEDTVSLDAVTVNGSYESRAEILYQDYSLNSNVSDVIVSANINDFSVHTPVAIYPTGDTLTHPSMNRDNTYDEPGDITYDEFGNIIVGKNGEITIDEYAEFLDLKLKDIAKGLHISATGYGVNDYLTTESGRRPFDSILLYATTELWLDYNRDTQVQAASVSNTDDDICFPANSIIRFTAEGNQWYVYEEDGTKWAVDAMNILPIYVLAIHCTTDFQVSYGALASNGTFIMQDYDNDYLCLFNELKDSIYSRTSANLLPSIYFAHNILDYDVHYKYITFHWYDGEEKAAIVSEDELTLVTKQGYEGLFFVTQIEGFNGTVEVIPSKFSLVDNQGNLITEDILVMYEDYRENSLQSSTLYHGMTPDEDTQEKEYLNTWLQVGLTNPKVSQTWTFNKVTVNQNSMKPRIVYGAEMEAVHGAYRLPTGLKVLKCSDIPTTSFGTAQDFIDSYKVRDEVLQSSIELPFIKDGYLKVDLDVKVIYDASLNMPNPVLIEHGTLPPINLYYTLGADDESGLYFQYNGIVPYGDGKEDDYILNHIGTK